MPKPFHELTLDEFADLVGQFHFTRRIESVHVHHTWRPNHADFASRPAVATIEAMHRFHTQVNHWSDLAQHVTIDPNGKIWTGRNWNAAPASATGFNGNSMAGPFMFEMIGDFDRGRDVFAGAQKASAIGVITALLRRFDLPVDAVRFHHQMSSKTCPGSAIDRKAFLDEIRAAMEEPAAREFGLAAAAGAGAFGEGVTAVRQRSLSIIANWQVDSRGVEPAAVETEPGEDSMDANQVAVATGAELPGAIAARGIFGGGAEFTAEEKQALRPHVVNLRLGLFSDTGKFTTSPADVQRMFDEFLPEELERQKAQGRPLRIVFYAHGGLVSEQDGIRPCLRRLPFWRQNNLYPIFFCWETGLAETVTDIVRSLFKGERGIVSDSTDAVLEAVSGAAGRKVWGEMKRSAELASMNGGGARAVAELTRNLWNAHHEDIEIHAVGHSAGSIFHAFFLPVLLDQRVGNGVAPIRVKTLHFLAPACTTELFESRLKDRIGANKQILKHTMYTMNQDLEQDDTAGPYQKSLLYLVSRAFETKKPAAILGLEESLRDDAALIRFYGLSRTIPGVAQVLFSKTQAGASADSATESTKHGDFDNEVKTMNSVARRILEQPAGTIASFVDEASQSEVTRALTTPIAAGAGREADVRAGASGQKPVTRRGARRALCIGIDAYPAPNALAGCVNDARDWSAVLAEIGFEVKQLLNQQAKREAILAAMREMIAVSRPGDAVVFQYAGHGTQVTDLDGEETDGKDEALVPIDFQTGSFLIDDDIRAIMQTIPDGVSVTCFMDCCHSGTNTRFLGPTPATETDGSRPRFMVVSPEVMQAHIEFRTRVKRGFVPAPRAAATMREVNFAACRPDQVALESQGSGDFTRRAVPILRAGAAALTNEAFQKRVIEAFGGAAKQEPTLDCAAETRALSLFGGAEAAAAAAAGASDVGAILGRLDNIERRLTKLGG